MKQTMDRLCWRMVSLDMDSRLRPVCDYERLTIYLSNIGLYIDIYICLCVGIYVPLPTSQHQGRKRGESHGVKENLQRS